MPPAALRAAAAAVMVPWLATPVPVPSPLPARTSTASGPLAFRSRSVPAAKLTVPYGALTAPALNTFWPSSATSPLRASMVPKLTTPAVEVPKNGRSPPLRNA